MPGIFYGVGVGPGDPELLTVKAVNVIKKADIIITPKTEKNQDSFALNIIKSYINDSSEVVDQIFPMINNETKTNEAWMKNKNQIIAFLNEGRDVVFITLGDPMVYSTYIYIFKLLKKDNYTVITIPGITSFCDIASKANFPLAEGREILRIVPATIDEESLEEIFKSSDNLVLMKVYKNYEQIIEKMKKYGYINNSVLLIF